MRHANKLLSCVVMTTQEDLTVGVELAKQNAGNGSALATALGINRVAVYQWKRVPAERVRDVSRITGVPDYLLRPDLFDPPSDPERESA